MQGQAYLANLTFLNNCTAGAPAHWENFEIPLNIYYGGTRLERKKRGGLEQIPVQGQFDEEEWIELVTGQTLRASISGESPIYWRERLRNYGEFALIYQDEFEATRIKNRWDINGVTGPGVDVALFDSTVCRVETGAGGTTMFRERCALRIKVEASDSEPALPKLERLLKASLAPTGRTYNFINRISNAFEICHFQFIKCDTQCSDCVACRGGHEIDACKAQKANELSPLRACGRELERTGLIEDIQMAVHCAIVCPQKVLYPVCTSCCHCLVFDAFQNRIRGAQLAQAGGPALDYREPVYESEDYDKVYVEESEPEKRFHIIQNAGPSGIYLAAATAVVIGGLVAFALKKGALRDKAERSMRIDIMSKRRKKLYHATGVDKEMKSQFPHPVFKSSGEVDVMRNVDPTAIARMRPVLQKEEDKYLLVEQPKLGWKDFMKDQEIIDRQIEESVPEMDRPVCLDFLRGYCPNPKCLNRHEDDGSVIAPPARTTIPKDAKVAKKAEATFPQKRAMSRIGVQGKRVNRSNAQQVARPHGLPIPMHPADILKAKGPGAQESSDSGSGSLPDDYEGGDGSSARLEEVESPVRTTDDQPTDGRPFPEKRKVLLAPEMSSSRPAPEDPDGPRDPDEPTKTRLDEPTEETQPIEPEEPQPHKPEEPQPDGPEVPQPDEPEEPLLQPDEP
jgi:hypothetical protein